MSPLRIVKIRLEPKLVKHLASLGLIEGEVVEVLESRGGATIVKVKEGRLALDSATSRGILVAA